MDLTNREPRSVSVWRLAPIRGLPAGPLPQRLPSSDLTPVHLRGVRVACSIAIALCNPNDFVD